jgi:hypothetical protein
MATNKTSKSSAPKALRTTKSILGKLQQDLIDLDYMDFASEAKMNRLIAGFLRTNGYRAPAKRFTEQAKYNALCAKAC